MTCPFCNAVRATSTLAPNSFTSSTCMASSPGHYTEGGKWMPSRDPNWHTQGFSCSRGHRYEVVKHDGDPDVVRLISSMTTFPALSEDDALDWRCNVRRSHGFCNTMNDAGDASCGACGESRP